MIKGRRFRPGWFMTVVTIAFCGLTIAAGNWQRGRAIDKAALQHQLDTWAREAPVSVPSTPVRSEAFALRRVQAAGYYDQRHAILLDNKVYRGRAGYHVVTPLRLADKAKAYGIPGITVIGYNRRVDWRELTSRLKRITEDNVRAVVK